MNSKVSAVTRLAALSALALAAPAVWATPVTVNPGDSGVAVPIYPASSGTPTYTVLGTTGVETAFVETGPAQGLRRACSWRSTSMRFAPISIPPA